MPYSTINKVIDEVSVELDDSYDHSEAWLEEPEQIRIFVNDPEGVDEFGIDAIVTPITQKFGYNDIDIKVLDRGYYEEEVGNKLSIRFILE